MRNYLMIFFVSLCAYSYAQNVYVRYTNLHHVQQSQTIELNKDSLYFIMQSKDTTIYMEKGLKSDCISSDKLTILENGKVIKFKESFFIRKGVKSKRIFSKYVNKDIRF